MTGRRAVADSGPEIAAWIKGTARADLNEIHNVVKTNGALLKRITQRNASGRPGPRIVTGNYRRRWKLQVTRNSFESRASLSNDSPQAWRLNRGFYGRDSLGRFYWQPPYPDVFPALVEVETEFFFDIEKALRK